MSAEAGSIRVLAALGTAAMAMLLHTAVSAADFVIVNTNASGVGFNDPAPANPAAGGDISGTLGQQRLAVFIKAAEQWGALLESDVEIRVQAQMVNQTCGPDGTVLGSAGPISLVADFANAPRAATAYHIAQANSLAGTDLLPGSNDISTQFNLAIDTGCSTNTVGWWYGTDPSVPVPADRIPLLPVVFHELGHGLGFSASVSLSTGNYFSSNPSVWSNHLYDLSTEQHWRSMTAGQRLASASNDPNLVWTGSETNRYSLRILAASPVIIVNTPESIAGTYAPIQPALFGPPFPTSALSAEVAVAEPLLGCSELTNPAQISGRIALIDRGSCNFSVKAEFAEAAGAVAVLIANNTSGLPPMGGSSATLGIPAVGITQALGDQMKANLPAPGVNLTLVEDASTPAGTNQGCMRMFAPNPVQQGSSVSHFTSDATPNLLIEPALSRSIFDRVDLTIELFRDIGWVTNRDELLFFDGFDPAGCEVQPIP